MSKGAKTTTEAIPRTALLGLAVKNLALKSGRRSRRPKAKNVRLLPNYTAYGHSLVRKYNGVCILALVFVYFSCSRRWLSSLCMRAMLATQMHSHWATQSQRFMISFGYTNSCCITTVVSHVFRIQIAAEYIFIYHDFHNFIFMYCIWVGMFKYVITISFTKFPWMIKMS